MKLALTGSPRLAEHRDAEGSTYMAPHVSTVTRRTRSLTAFCVSQPCLLVDIHGFSQVGELFQKPSIPACVCLEEIASHPWPNPADPAPACFQCRHGANQHCACCWPNAPSSSRRPIDGRHVSCWNAQTGEQFSPGAYWSRKLKPLSTLQLSTCCPPLRCASLGSLLQDSILSPLSCCPGDPRYRFGTVSRKEVMEIHISKASDDPSRKWRRFGRWRSAKGRFYPTPGYPPRLLTVEMPWPMC